MKKSLLLAAAALFAFSACTDDIVVEENTQVNQPKEIAFAPLAQPNTRAAIDGTEFPTSSNIQVAAYDITNDRDFFGATTFNHADGTIWKGGKYWPLTATEITFLAYTNFQGTVGSETNGATWAISPSTHKASGVTLVMTDNKTAQKDLMYAKGNGQVTQTGNSLNFPTTVPMVFKHAQAWISFNADAFDAASSGEVTLKSITLNGASYSGTYTITHTNYNNYSTNNVSGAWTVLGAKGTDSSSDPTSLVSELVFPNTQVVPNWTAAAITYDGSGDGVSVGDGLLIVPDDNDGTADFKSFTINYELDGNTYDFTYIPATASAANVQQMKHYIYNIVFHLHEIEISATVTDWDDQTATQVPIY